MLKDVNAEATLDLDDHIATAFPQNDEWKAELEPPPSFADARFAEREALHAPEAPRRQADEAPARKKAGLLRRRPLAAASGALLIAATVGGGSLWYDYGNHFESTDDAFIAARQIAIAPKIAGYVSAVPVTDNQHVAAGETIARIDDRDYRVALAQAEAQVAAAAASIETIDQQIAVQTAQIEFEQGAGRSGAGRADLRAAAGLALRDAGEIRRGLGPERPAV